MEKFVYFYNKACKYIGYAIAECADRHRYQSERYISMASSYIAMFDTALKSSIYMNHSATAVANMLQTIDSLKKEVNSLHRDAFKALTNPKQLGKVGEKLASIRSTLEKMEAVVKDTLGVVEQPPQPTLFEKEQVKAEEAKKVSKETKDS